MGINVGGTYYKYIPRCTNYAVMRRVLQNLGHITHIQGSPVDQWLTPLYSALIYVMSFHGGDIAATADWLNMTEDTIKTILFDRKKFPHPSFKSLSRYELRIGTYCSSLSSELSIFENAYGTRYLFRPDYPVLYIGKLNSLIGDSIMVEPDTVEYLKSLVKQHSHGITQDCFSSPEKFQNVTLYLDAAICDSLYLRKILEINNCLKTTQELH